LPFCPARSRKTAKADAKPISQVERNQVFILVALAAVLICPARSRKTAKADAEPISQVKRNQVFILIALAAAFIFQTWVWFSGRMLIRCPFVMPAQNLTSRSKSIFISRHRVGLPLLLPGTNSNASATKPPTNLPLFGCRGA